MPSDVCIICNRCVQATLDRDYDDISGFAMYMDSTWVGYTDRFLSIWVSPTAVWQQGVVAANNVSVPLVAPSANIINCTVAISNARYVTVIRNLATTSTLLRIWEFQVLRSGACSRHVCPHSKRVLLPCMHGACLQFQNGCLENTQTPLLQRPECVMHALFYAAQPLVNMLLLSALFIFCCFLQCQSHMRGVSWARPNGPQHRNTR